MDKTNRWYRMLEMNQFEVNWRMKTNTDFSRDGENWLPED